MLSRRSIRVKVMQSLFILYKDEALDIKAAMEFYDRSVQDAFNLYLFNLYTLINISRYALEDESTRQSKHLPSAEDKTFSAKLYNNELVQSMVKNADLQGLFKKNDFSNKIDQDLLKRIYKRYAQEDSYRKYIRSESETKDHVNALHDLYRICRRDELFEEIMEDNYPNWLDDKSLIIGTVKKTIKSLPTTEDFHNEFLPDAETVETFGRELLRKVNDDNDYLLSLISPVLENWDVERVALVDILFIKMALCEFLNFVTIPTKVTLNEYVELSKEYSTEKSKDFINGILDKLMRKMKEEGMIKKEGRGLLA
jgi:N utilization substance protein B